MSRKRTIEQARYRVRRERRINDLRQINSLHVVIGPRGSNCWVNSNLCSASFEKEQCRFARRGYEGSFRARKTIEA